MSHCGAQPGRNLAAQQAPDRSSPIRYAFTLAKGQRMLSGQLQRREFITLLGGAMAWPFIAHVWQPLLPMIGFLSAWGKVTGPTYARDFAVA
jgi:hypothetical protein